MSTIMHRPAVNKVKRNPVNVADLGSTMIIKPGVARELRIRQIEEQIKRNQETIDAGKAIVARARSKA